MSRTNDVDANLSERAPLLERRGADDARSKANEDVERGTTTEEGERKDERARANEGVAFVGKHAAIVLAIASTLIWFASNIANNIALQDFHEAMTFDSVAIEPRMEAMTFVTAVQMLCGVAMAIALKAVVGGEKSWTLLRNGGTSAFALALGASHGFGSLATNMGFMFGSASFVQIIKLFEPWEMLTFDCIVKQWQGKPLQLTLGVVLSMAVIVGSAVSLLVDKMNGGSLIGALFAVTSGLLITSRIVFQKTFRFADSKSGFTQSLDEYLVMTFNALLVLIVTFLIQFTISRTAENGEFVDIADVVSLFRAELILFHPVYNLFSLVTLTFVASITHALLNVSKRVIGLLITLLWFHEEITPRILCGAAAALVGGFWYTIEKRASSSPGYDSCWRLAILERKPRERSESL